MAITAPQRSAVHTQKTLLIVDGHAGVRAALARRLERASGIHAVATDGLAAALELVGELAPDAVVCDPKTLALDASEAVRLLATRGAPVVVLTSSLHDGEAEALHDAGAAAQLLKGYSLADIMAAVEAAIAGRTAPLSSTR